MKYLKIISANLIFLGLIIFGAYIGSFSHSYKFVFNFFLSFIIVYFLLERKNRVLLYSYIIIALMFTVILFYINDFIFYSLHLPSSLSLILGIFFAFLFYNASKFFKVSLVILILLINIFVVHLGYDYWIHKLNYQTFSGNYLKKINPNKFVFYDSNGEKVIFKNNITYVLDFWTTSCGLCFKDFPQVSKLNSINKDKNIEFYAVNFLSDGESIYTNKNVLKNKGIKIKELFFTGSNRELYENSSIYAFPTILMIKNDSIIFKGNSFSLKNTLL